MTSRRTRHATTAVGSAWQGHGGAGPGTPGTTVHAASSRAAVLFEIGLATVAFLSYFLVRGLTESGVDRAATNGERLVRLEKWLGIYHEAAIQELAASHSWLVNLANWVYIWGHWPVIIAVGTWLLLASPPEYRKLRNSFLISGSIGLVVFATFPVSPPRLLEIGLIDTVTDRSVAYRVLQPPAFVNQYAAMPSLHFGWDLLVGIVLVRHAPSRWTRAVGVALPVAMAWAVVATANHFLLDGLVGGALALLGLAIASRAAAQLDSAQASIECFVGGLIARGRASP